MSCTGVCASWCPVCGDCTCPRSDDGEPVFRYADPPPVGLVTVVHLDGPPVVGTVEDPACPLHGEATRHALDDDAAPG